jgi:hypothetical protein
MLGMLRDLVQHKAWASATLLAAVRASDTASRDDDLRVLLHHIILANRFWLFSCLDRPFAVAEEARVPDSLDAVCDLFRSTHAIEAEWISGITQRIRAGAPARRTADSGRELLDRARLHAGLPAQPGAPLAVRHSSSLTRRSATGDGFHCVAD